MDARPRRQLCDARPRNGLRRPRALGHDDRGSPVPRRTVIGFNGTTEWALDSVEQSEALWVPAEHQLRELLGDAFAGLAPTGNGYRVTLSVDGATSGHEALDPAEAYALALLHLLRSGRA